MKTFPLDCEKDCPHLTRYDMSVDDWTSICDILKEQIDDCDGAYIRCRCPLEMEQKDGDGDGG